MILNIGFRGSVDHTDPAPEVDAESPRRRPSPRLTQEPFASTMQDPGRCRSVPHSIALREALCTGNSPALLCKLAPARVSGLCCDRAAR